MYEKDCDAADPKGKMKPHFHIVPRDVQSAHLSRHHILPNFGTVWHYHPELEFHYIVRGEGVRFVGDNISNFNEGELLLLGEGLPHMWRCNEAYFRRDPSITAEAVVVQFLPDFLGKDFLEMREAGPLLNVYDKARLGLVIYGHTKEKIVPLMYESVHADAFGRVVLIMSMLEILSKSQETECIASAPWKNESKKIDVERIGKIYRYVMEHYQQPVTLEEIASVANLSQTSFCRYFKTMAKKTFYDFLTEVRISHARRLLIEDQGATTEAICFECGFNNRSNFFGHFKRITGLTPVEYRKKYLFENVFA